MIFFFLKNRENIINEEKVTPSCHVMLKIICIINILGRIKINILSVYIRGKFTRRNFYLYYSYYEKTQKAEG